jgi:hypothetical protein
MMSWRERERGGAETGKVRWRMGDQLIVCTVLSVYLAQVGAPQIANTQILGLADLPQVYQFGDLRL